jgi:Flp pilus assembly protein CpaB
VSERFILWVGISLVALAVIVSTALVPGRGAAGDSPSEAPPVARSLAARVPAGQVATAIRFSRVESAGGGLRPGDVIDVYTHFPERALDGGPFTRLLLGSRPVYAAVPDNDFVSVTLVVSPEEAILLQNALQIGARPFAVLRSAKGEPSNSTPVSINDEYLASWIQQVGSSR